MHRLAGTETLTESRILAMNRDALVQALDEEITRLEKARALLTGHTAPLKRGMSPTSGRRKVSAEARARMAVGQKARRKREKAS
jgi:hypothetical protein